MIDRMITRIGYPVIATGDVEEAQRLCLATSTPRVSLLITDVVMPAMRGPALANAIRAQRPDLPVLFMTGYDPNRADLKVDQDHVLQKPFGSDLLSRRIREALEEAEARSSP
jgi:CheY-like chemotaxis protein